MNEPDTGNAGDVQDPAEEKRVETPDQPTSDTPTETTSERTEVSETVTETPVADPSQTPSDDSNPS